MSKTLPWTLGCGRWGLFAWLLSGMVLEALHLFKAPFYLEDPLRRELWVLAHAHGALLSAISLLIVALVPRLTLSPARWQRIDRGLAVGALLVPWGFLLGGIGHGEADPSPAILLVPVGALLLAVSLGQIALAKSR